MKKTLTFVGGFFVIIICIGIFASNKSNSNPTTTQIEQSTQQIEQSTQQIEQSTQQIEQSTEQSTEKVENSYEAETPSVPKEYISALKTAENYLEIFPYSKKGLYNQLTSEYGEQFSTEAAQYAIDNVKVDYKENALKAAITYQETMHMSTKAIYDQLISEYGEQFTAEEAQYAIDNLPK